MLGNWAMGSLDMATRPRMTMRMAITMATIGRLIKNLDIAGYLFSAGWATGFVSGLTTGAGAAAFSSGLSGVVAAVWAFGEHGFGVTGIPGLTFWVPSTTTVSPGFSPSAMIHSEPIRSATLTGLMSTFLSAPTTATRNFPWISVTARWGISKAPFLTDMIARTSP